MTVQVSTGQKIVQIAALAPLYTGGHIRVFNGVRPATADLAESTNGSQLIGYITHAGAPVFEGSAALNFQAEGPYLLNDYLQYWILTPTATDVATWFRVVGNPLDDGGVSYVNPRMDGDVVVGSGELNLPDNNLVLGSPVGPISFLYTIPPIIGT